MDVAAIGEWLFDGLGTAAIGLFIGAAGGGAVGYRMGKNNKITMKAEAGDRATQVQVGQAFKEGKE